MGGGDLVALHAVSANVSADTDRYLKAASDRAPLSPSLGHAPRVRFKWKLDVPGPSLATVLTLARWLGKQDPPE